MVINKESPPGKLKTIAQRRTLKVSRKSSKADTAGVKKFPGGQSRSINRGQISIGSLKDKQLGFVSDKEALSATMQTVQSQETYIVGRRHQ